MSSSKKRKLDLDDFSDDDDYSELTWRGDPSETFSDLTLQVDANSDLFEEGTHLATYHVHKSVVCAGKYRSKYLEKLIRNRSMPCTGDNSNEIEKEASNKHVEQKKPSSNTQNECNDEIEKASKNSDALENQLTHGQENASHVDLNKDDGNKSDNNGASTIGTRNIQDDIQHENSNEIRIRVKEHVEKKHFDYLLDNIYFGTSPITRKNVMPLRYLAKLMKVKSLFDRSSDFISQDLQDETVFWYMQQSTLFDDHKVQVEAKRLCACEIENMDETKFLELEISTFKEIIKETTPRSSDDTAMSIIVSKYIKKHTEAIDTDLFVMATAEKLLPKIAEKEAIFLLQQCQAHHRKQDLDDATKTSLDNLLKRCMDCIANNWRPILGDSIRRQESFEDCVYDSLPNDVKVKVLEASLMNVLQSEEKLRAPKKQKKERKRVLKPFVINMPKDQETVDIDDSDSDSESENDSDEDGILEISDEPIYN
ncbi:hypothetical protein CTEN210_08732 [Chaetoceros tenuissimus]|uniref:BTB domain-containing protein n=1 Tax=Chaetoceros tenuissimus TaxID=426638 RepID=A0AAD3CU28_9STRA|nr:hypothetical protein CTEN210_08732 [Chaetoceros tenuissimus]